MRRLPYAAPLLIGLAALPAFHDFASGVSQPASDATVWIQTNGPQGGRIVDLVIDPTDPRNLYAIGSSDGAYRSTDEGLSWQLVPFTTPPVEAPDVLAIDPNNPSVLLAGSNNDFLRSADGAVTWQTVDSGFDACTRWIDVIVWSPSVSNVVYAGGQTHCDDTSGTLYRSVDGGLSWNNIGEALEAPAGAAVEGIAVGESGRLLVAINDRRLSGWGNGRLFVSEDEGLGWREIEYGQREDRFIWSVYVNPHDPSEVWLSEATLFNEIPDQPALYRSTDAGESWSPISLAAPVDLSQIRVLAATPDGRVYVAGGGGLAVTEDEGVTWRSAGLPDDIVRFDLTSLTLHPTDANRLFLPTGAGGVAHSSDGGATWALRNEGIIATNISLVATDTREPGIAYAASTGGEGTFRSQDFGETWTLLNSGGIVHPFGDELVVDPTDPEQVWFISDVPYIHRSFDRGASWVVVADPFAPGKLSFFSAYAIAQATNPDVVYASNNGFGIFRGVRIGPTEWDWRFLRASEIDYTYSLAAEPDDENVVYSGYIRKPFETAARVSASYDGGNTWFTALEVDGASGVTSVAISRSDPARVFAASVGAEGGRIWASSDRGQSWERAGETFNFATVHAWTATSDGQVAYAGVWGGGTYRTRDGGATWDELPSPESFPLPVLHSILMIMRSSSSPIVFRRSCTAATMVATHSATSSTRDPSIDV